MIKSLNLNEGGISKTIDNFVKLFNDLSVEEKKIVIKYFDISFGDMNNYMQAK